MTHDLERDLRALAPDDLTRAAPDWEQRRDEILASITAEPPTTVTPIADVRQRRVNRLVRRGSIAIAAAFALILGLVIMPGVLSPAPQAAADMNRLAIRARSQGTEFSNLKPGQVIHIVTQGVQIVGPNDVARGMPPTIERTGESWVDAAGLEWSWGYPRKKMPDGSWQIDPTAPMVLQNSGPRRDASPNYPSVAFIATLPSDATALRKFLDPIVSGSTSHEEAILVAGADMLRTEIVPAEKRAAIFEMIGQTKTAQTEKVTSFQGKPAVRLSWSSRPGMTTYLVIDEETAQVVEAGSSHDNGASTMGRYLERTIVDGLPTKQ